MADQKDATVHAVQAAATDAVRDRAAIEPGCDQLSGRNNAVLLGGKHCDGWIATEVMVRIAQHHP